MHRLGLMRLMNEEHGDSYETWLKGDPKTYDMVAAMRLPTKFSFSDGDFDGLGPFTTQAQHILKKLGEQFGENLPYVFHIACCMSIYTEHRSGLPSEHNFSINLLSYDEDQVSIKFRTSTPIKAPISGKYLLLADSLFSLSKAANSIKLNDLESTLHYLYEATSKITTVVASENIAHTKLTLDFLNKKEKSKYGSTGTSKKIVLVNKMKEWAKEAHSQEKGRPSDIARSLAKKIPEEIRQNESWVQINNPERILYDYINELNNPAIQRKQQEKKLKKLNNKNTQGIKNIFDPHI